MVDKNSDKVARRYLLLFKLDVQNLFNRLWGRKHEYITLFALKRSREHYETIFKSRYESATFDDLAYCDEETITALDQFYSYVEEIKWYLDHTQDMPNTIEDELTRMFHRLEDTYRMVMLYIDAELGVKSDAMAMDFSSASEEPTFESSSEEEGASEDGFEGLPESFEADFSENPWTSEEDESSDESSKNDF